MWPVLLKLQNWNWFEDTQRDSWLITIDEGSDLMKWKIQKTDVKPIGSFEVETSYTKWMKTSQFMCGGYPRSPFSLTFKRW